MSMWCRTISSSAASSMRRRTAPAMPNSFQPVLAYEIWQLLGAAACGALIGLQRQVHGKPAGITTLAIVTLASTLILQLGFHLAQMGGGPTPADPARIASGVLTGIGFLGAGIIIRQSRQV